MTSPETRARRSSARAASDRLWVTTMRVHPCSEGSDSSRPITAVAVSSSRLPVGSSARISCGRFDSARAMATRCRSPPESSKGRWLDPVGQSNLLEQFDRPPAPFGPGNAREGEREFEVLERGQRLEEAEVLENEADT